MVEVLITISVIVIMTTIAVPQLNGAINRSRDNERASKITIISEALEKFYQQNGEYPPCTDLTKSSQTVVTDTLKQVDPVVLTAPGAAAGTNSITCDVNGVNNFAYKINTDGSYTLTYTKEADNIAVPLIGRYSSINTLGDTVISPTLINNNQIDISWTAVTDATQYRVQRSTDSSFATGVTDITTTELAMSSVDLTSGVRYYFRIMAKSINASSNWIAVNYATTITTPAAPVVTANTAGDITTWSWPAVVCSVGTANYQYRHTSAGFDSGLVATTNLSVQFTTIVENQTYTVAVQSRCSTTDTSSDWSGASSVNYTRPPSLPALGGTLESYTWAQIEQIANAGQGSSYFQIGNTKNITLSTGEVVTLQIYDFNHDDKTSGGKANITFGLKNLLADLRRMQPSDQTAGGWNASEMRTWMGSTLYGQLPESLRTVIKSVNKLASGGYYSPSVATSVDKLFIFSASEVFGSNTNWQNEGVQYPIFTDNSSRIKKLSNGTGSAYDWWTRTPPLLNSSPLTVSLDRYQQVVDVGDYIQYKGSAWNGWTSSSFGVCFGFSI